MASTAGVATVGLPTKNRDGKKFKYQDFYQGSWQLSAAVNIFKLHQNMQFIMYHSVFYWLDTPRLHSLEQNYANNLCLQSNLTNVFYVCFALYAVQDIWDRLFLSDTRTRKNHEARWSQNWHDTWQ